jgi:hypothetical protein
MSPGAKIFITVLVAGGVLGALALAGSSASAAEKEPQQPQPGDETPPDVIVPEPGQPPQAQPPQAQPQPFPPSSPPFVPQPFPPSAAPPVAPPAVVPTPSPTPGAISLTTLPNPLGGAPLGQFDPATGRVFGPAGTQIGTFDPKTGLFTGLNGMQIQIPGFGGSSPPLQTVPAPVPSAPATPATPATPIPPAVVVPTPTGPVSIPLPPVASVPSQPQLPGPGATTIETDTAQMVSALLAAEASAGWNIVPDPNVTAWQEARPPLKVDGKFGPKSALGVAATFGTLPLIRSWPAGSQKTKALNDYRAALIKLANTVTDPTRAAQLRASAQRENAQSFGVKGKALPVPLSDQVQIQKVA